MVAAVVVSILGIDRGAAGKLMAWCTAIDEEVEYFTVGAPAGARTAVALRAPQSGVARAIEQPGNESVLQAVAGNSDLDREEVVANAVFLALASINPEAAIVNTIFHLLRDPHQLELVRGGSGSVPWSDRGVATAGAGDGIRRPLRNGGCKLAGCKIRRGDLVRVSISAANGTRLYSPTRTGSTAAERTCQPAHLRDRAAQVHRHPSRPARGHDRAGASFAVCPVAADPGYANSRRG